jgi:DNA-binding transcriptional regulator YhcF (GntR family)
VNPYRLKKRGSYKIYKAINKYGRDSFYIELLEDNISIDDLDSKEIEYIEKYNSFKKGYNSTVGGDSKTISKIQDVLILKSMFNEGCSVKVMAEFFKVNKMTVQRTLHGLNLRRNKILNKSILLENILLTNVQIADKFNVHFETVSRAFKKHGILRGKGCNNHLNKQNKSSISKDTLLKYIHLKNSEIAKILGVSETCISRSFKRYAIVKKLYK